MGLEDIKAYCIGKRKTPGIFQNHFEMYSGCWTIL